MGCQPWTISSIAQRTLVIQPLEADVGDRIALDQAAEQFVLSKDDNIPAAPNSSLGGKRRGHAASGKCDGVRYGVVELDEADADGCQFSWAYPTAHERAQHESTKAAVILRETRKRDALGKHRLGFAGSPSVPVRGRPHRSRVRLVRSTNRPVRDCRTPRTSRVEATAHVRCGKWLPSILPCRISTAPSRPCASAWRGEPASN